MKFLEKLFGRIKTPRYTGNTKYIPIRIYKRFIIAKKVKEFYIPDEERYIWIPVTYKNKKGARVPLTKMIVRNDIKED